MTEGALPQSSPRAALTAPSEREPLLAFPRAFPSSLCEREVSASVLTRCGAAKHIQLYFDFILADAGDTADDSEMVFTASALSYVVLAQGSNNALADLSKGLYNYYLKTLAYIQAIA